ncbi:MAG: ribosome biogenesis GTP-binding protein YihA/YsxC [Betaproteobacteria bacterium]|nr:ribosome biogenesis GTP-binding protein YihA/YsxC [Betaproteobacteria bacterium]MDH5579167.1 ribosome biogenesis GTP-binding protein YihA/YsxC [Betaproteobacteria bacterium]
MPESSSAFSRVAFLVSAGITGGVPPPDMPEVAFAGRSNVGKSSAINALTNRRRLAYFSKTPGRTQTINFFDLGGRARLVDLPGYGYARVPQALRTQWDQLVGSYLETRDSLAGVVVLMDARRPFTPHDEHLLRWLRPVGRRLLVLLAKSDKLSRAERDAALHGARARLASTDPGAQVMLFSSQSGAGVEQARALLDDWLRAARAE